jgi:hypothetical protein
MRRFLIAVLCAFAILVVLAFSFVLVAGNAARGYGFGPVAVATQVASGTQQFYDERGCLPLVPAALFDSIVATSPQTYLDCIPEDVSRPYARPYLAKHYVESSTGALLIKDKRGGITRVSLGRESDGANVVNYVRLEGLSIDEVGNFLYQCNGTRVTPSGPFVDKCRSPSSSAVDMRFDITDHPRVLLPAR